VLPAASLDSFLSLPAKIRTHFPAASIRIGQHMTTTIAALPEGGKRRGSIRGRHEAVLVTSSTSTGHNSEQYWSLLATSTGSLTDQ